MDNIRLILIFALAFVLLLLYQAWMEDYGKPTTQPIATTPAAPSSGTPVSGADTLSAPAEVPPAPVQSIEAGQGDTPRPAVEGSLFTSGDKIQVETDVLRVEINAVGGDIRNLFLLDYPRTTDKHSEPFQLLNDEVQKVFVVQSGLYSAEQKAPTHLEVFSSEHSEYVLEPGKDSLVVKLSWNDPSGITVEKSYTFTRGSYQIDFVQRIHNGSESDWNGREYRQLQRTSVAEESGNAFLHTYTGGALYSPEEKFQKISFDDMTEENLDRRITDGWAAMIQLYFLGAWIPPAEETASYFTRALSHSRFAIGMYSPPVTLRPGESHEFRTKLFIGPKLQDRLADVAPGLELSVDYGWLTVVSQPLFWLLDKIHGVVNNWGWAIIILTIFIKLAFFKLSETSYKSMANMRRVAPRLQALKDRYGDDKQRLNQAMMEMYKKEKINPLGGCLPILVQIPVFIALYWVLLESVELRQAPFMLWINNLSAPDPFYILPLIMGVSMFIQQKLNPAPLDPMQAKIMMSLPFVFTIFFAFFPAGLVLYWVVNNILSIAQQWYITRQIEKVSK